MNTRTLRRSCLTLALLAGLALPACEEQDPISAAIEDARLALDSVALAVTPLSDTDEADKAEADLTQVVSNLRAATSGGTPGQKQAASLLLAQAELGIADRRAAYAGRAEREALDALGPIRVLVDAMLSEGSRCSALTAYDAAPVIAQIEALITSKDAEIAQRQRDRAQIEADILMLRQGAEERLTMSAARRDEAARLANATLAQPATQAAGSMEEVHRVRREADAIELDGANLLSRAEVRQPELNERTALVEQVVAQKAELEASLQATRDRATASADTAARHAQAFVAAAHELDALIEAAISHRNTVATPRVDAAIEAYNAADSTAAAAGADGRGLAAAAAQGEGDMLWLRAQTIQLLADTLEQVALTPIPSTLGGADRDDIQAAFNSYATRVIQLREAQTAALSAAADAYGEARDGFNSLQSRDEAGRARVNRLANLMHACRRAANGEAVDLNAISNEPGDFTEASDAEPEPQPEQPAEDPAPTEDPATPHGDGG